MHDGNIAILRAPEIRALLAGRELELMQVVRTAYATHGAGDSSLPHSTFLRLPGQLILNSPLTGRREAVLDGSVISAKRTAASAALAANCLLNGQRVGRVGMIGCGPINFEIARFLLAAFPEVDALLLFDSDPARARQFAMKCHDTLAALKVEIATDVEAVLRDCVLVSIATTAVTPHLSELRDCPQGSAILHISLRDLTPGLILGCDNVVDDIDHVCRAETSVHLAEQLVGHRDFIRCTLADILVGRAPARNGSETVSVFSPFGLGVLDLAVAKLVRELALRDGREKMIGAFLPGSWADEG